jgi:hypothetical protein
VNGRVTVGVPGSGHRYPAAGATGPPGAPTGRTTPAEATANAAGPAAEAAIARQPSSTTASTRRTMPGSVPPKGRPGNKTGRHLWTARVPVDDARLSTTRGTKAPIHNPGNP